MSRQSGEMISPGTLPRESFNQELTLEIDNLEKGYYPVSRLSALTQSAFEDMVESFPSNPQMLVIDRTIPFINDYDFPTNIEVQFINNAKIDVAAGKTVNINTPVNEGNKVLFTGLGRVILKKNTRINMNWFGVLGDGVTDDAAKWKTQIEEPSYRHIFFPVPVVAYNLSKIVITTSNKKIEFEEGSTIQGHVIAGVGQLGTFDYLVVFRYCVDLLIVGNRTTFLNNRTLYPQDQNKGVFRFMSCENVRAERLIAKDSPGDGFYIAPQDYGFPCVDIELVDCVADNCVRNGLTVVSVNGLTVRDCLFENMTGASPQAGIDFEPNQSNERLDNIRVINVTTRNNRGTGILVVPYKLKDQGRSIDITIDNHISDNDLHGGQVGEHDGALDGRVIWNNPVWRNSAQSAFLAFNWWASGPRVEINNAMVLDCGRLSFFTIKALFLIYRHNPGGTGLIGNIHILRPTIVDNRTIGAEVNPAYNGNTFHFQDAQDVGVIEDCSVIDPLEITGISDRTLTMYAPNASLVLSDKYKVFEQNITVNTSISAWRLKPRYHNAGATGSVTLTLPLYPIVKFAKEVEFEVIPAQTLRIELGSSQLLRPMRIEGTYIESNVPSSRIKLKRVGNFSWQVTDMIGPWKDSSGGIINFENALVLNRVSVVTATDLDNVVNDGQYSIDFNSIATTLLHSPSIRAGVLTVKNTGFAIYQRYTEFFGGPIYERSSQFMTLVGSTWYKVSKGFTTSIGYDPPNVAANSTVPSIVTIPGAVIGQFASAVLNRSLSGLKPLKALVTGNDEVTLYLENPTGGAINVDSGILKVKLEDL